MKSNVEHIYHEWQERLSRNDAAGLLSLYAADAAFESPLVPQLMETPTGILQGHGELDPFFRKLCERRPGARRFYRTGYLTNGRLLIWEYPRATPDGDQMDFVEVMEIVGGRIQSQRVYWGWLGVKVLRTDAYHR
jgi:SnoaL-like protein